MTRWHRWPHGGLRLQVSCKGGARRSIPWLGLVITFDHLTSPSMNKEFSPVLSECFGIGIQVVLVCLEIDVNNLIILRYGFFLPHGLSEHFYKVLSMFKRNALANGPNVTVTTVI